MSSAVINLIFDIERMFYSIKVATTSCSLLIIWGPFFILVLLLWKRIVRRGERNERWNNRTEINTESIKRIRRHMTIMTIAIHYKNGKKKKNHEREVEMFKNHTLWRRKYLLKYTREGYRLPTNANAMKRKKIIPYICCRRWLENILKMNCGWLMRSLLFCCLFTTSSDSSPFFLLLFMLLFYWTTHLKFLGLCSFLFSEPGSLFLLFC